MEVGPRQRHRHISRLHHTRRTVITLLDTVRRNPVIVVEDVYDLPSFVTVPLAQRVADKLCAMYERRGALELPSSRFRDLVDLMIVITRVDALCAAAVAAAVASETRRGDKTIPVDVRPPSRQWPARYYRLATRLLAPERHHFAAALHRLCPFAGSILEGTANSRPQRGAVRTVRHSVTSTSNHPASVHGPTRWHSAGSICWVLVRNRTIDSPNAFRDRRRARVCRW